MRKYITAKPYKAKIQLRPLDEKAYAFVKKQLKEEGVEIVDEFTRKEGIDILVSSSRAAFSLAKKFKKKFNGETKATRSLVGENKQIGKRIYRLTMLLRVKKE
jgi:nonsense-mediated mRNA decay protein 3